VCHVTALLLYSDVFCRLSTRPIRPSYVTANHSLSQYSMVVLTVVRVMIAMYRKWRNWGYCSSLTPEPIELKLCMSDYVAHRTPNAQRGN